MDEKQFNARDGTADLKTENHEYFVLYSKLAVAYPTLVRCLRSIHVDCVFRGVDSLRVDERLYKQWLEARYGIKFGKTQKILTFACATNGPATQFLDDPEYDISARISPRRICKTYTE